MNFACELKLDIISLEAKQLHSRRELTVSWWTDCVGAGLDCNMITQPNLGRIIMVTFKMVPSIARADMTIYICFANDAVPNCCLDLDCLEAG